MAYENYTQGAIKALNEAQNSALIYNHQEIKQEHLVAVFLSDSSGLIYSLLEKSGKDCSEILKEVTALIKKFPSVTGSGAKVYYSAEVSKVLAVAENMAKTQKDQFVGIEHLFCAILKNPSEGLKKVFLKEIPNYETVIK